MDLTSQIRERTKGQSQPRLDNIIECIKHPESTYAVSAELLANATRLSRGAEEKNDLSYPIENVELKAPVPRPNKIVAVLVNSQGMLGGADIRLTHPRLFMKASSAVIGPGETILAPASGVRPEVELGIIVGRRTQKADPDTAEKSIFGYTIFNDVTAPLDSKEDAYPAYRRDLSTGELRKTTLRGPLFRSKNHDTFAPMGPWIVTREELTDVGDLKMWTRFDGDVIQEGSTAEYLFTPKEILSFISGFLTLEPGDVIAAGTIGWIAAKRGDVDPSEWVLPSANGSLELEIEGIGVLKNNVRPGFKPD
jgi:2-keto-4-pentenoate hydratase/2-oxohepta-3-ene-1,7-dioic acid hydratase in catechol pathway